MCVLYVAPRRVPLHYRAKLLLGRLPLPLFTHSCRIPTKLPILNHPRVARQLPPIGLTVTSMLPPISHHKLTACNFAQSNTTISYPPYVLPPFLPSRQLAVTVPSPFSSNQCTNNIHSYHPICVHHALFANSCKPSHT